MERFEQVLRECQDAFPNTCEAPDALFRFRFGGVVQMLPEVFQPLPNPRCQGCQYIRKCYFLVMFPGDARFLRYCDRPELITVPDALSEHNEILWLKGILPGRKRRRGGAIKGAVGLLHEGKAVVIKAEPHVQAVLFDALPQFSVASARTFPTQAPPHLVNGYVVTVSPIWLLGKKKRGSHRGRTAAENCDFLRAGCSGLEQFFAGCDGEVHIDMER